MFLKGLEPDRAHQTPVHSPDASSCQPRPIHSGISTLEALFLCNSPQLSFTLWAEEWLYKPIISGVERCYPGISWAILDFTVLLSASLPLTNAHAETIQEILFENQRLREWSDDR